MSYTENDISVDKGAPVEFYKFIGSFGAIRYTSDNEPGVCDGELYVPIPGGIAKTSVETTSVVDSVVTVDIDVPASSQIALLYCYQKTPEMIRVEVRRAHRGDDWNTEFEIEHIGYALDTSVTGDVATIKTGSAIQAKMRGNVASIYYQRMCNHVLYDSMCKVNRDDWKITATVTKVQNQLITVDNDGTSDSELKAGEIVNTRTGEKRGIYDNNSNIVTISYPFVDIVPGDEVELVYGCDHKRTGHCKLRFDNVVNYGGFDFIPVVNPFTDLHFDSIVTETIKEEWRTRVVPPGTG